MKNWTKILLQTLESRKNKKIVLGFYTISATSFGEFNVYQTTTKRQIAHRNAGGTLYPGRSYSAKTFPEALAMVQKMSKSQWDLNPQFHERWVSDFCLTPEICEILGIPSDDLFFPFPIVV